MIWQLDVLLFGILIVTAIAAIVMKDLLAAVAVMSVYTLVIALLFAGMQALDVAFVEVGLGAGIVGVLLLAAVMATTRRAESEARGSRGRWLVIPPILGFIGLMLFASTGLPDRGDVDAPAMQHVAPAYVERSMDDTQTPNVVTALLADYRSQDTLGETLVILTAALGTMLVLARRDGTATESIREEGPG